MKETLQLQDGERLVYLPRVTYAQLIDPSGKNTRILELGMIKPRYNTGPRPLLIWLAGGGWEKQDRHMWIPMLTYYAERGFVVASVEYRLSHEATFPAPLEDVKTAIRFLRTHAEVFGIDPRKIAIMGESAGAHLAAMAATTHAHHVFEKGAWADQDDSVQAVVDWYGPNDLALQNPHAHNAGTAEAKFLGGAAADCPDQVRAANPITYITEQTPPFLILHGDADETVRIAQSELLYEALQKAGVPVDFYTLAGTGHTGLKFMNPKVYAIILAFLQKHLGV